MIRPIDRKPEAKGAICIKGKANAEATRYKDAVIKSDKKADGQLAQPVPQAKLKIDKNCLKKPMTLQRARFLVNHRQRLSAVSGGRGWRG